MTPRFSVIGIVVDDMGRALDFYRRLGLAVPDDASNEPHVEVPLPGDLKLAFDTVETIQSFDPSWKPPADGPRMAVAFACDSPADVDRTVGELEAAGASVHLAPFDAFWGMRYATVTDPDGNHVDLFAALDGATP
jgi:catechol 2,3-dioxygenase-like lactoylglutathione lyase family enzyme